MYAKVKNVGSLVLATGKIKKSLVKLLFMHMVVHRCVNLSQLIVIFLKRHLQHEFENRRRENRSKC